MKKTIISVAVALASMGAFAAEVAPTSVSQDVIDNLEVFGKVGVSYDSTSFNEVSESKFDYLRNTEVGVQTSAALTSSINTTAVVVGSFKEGEEHFGLTRVELGLEHKLGSIHFGKIDDRYDQATGQFDAFSDVFGTDLLDGYSATGKVEGFALSASPLTNLNVGLQLGNAVVGDIGDDLALTATYSIAGLDLSGAFRTKDVSSASIDESAYKFGAGYGFNNFYAGLVYETVDYSGEDETTVSLSGSYKLDAITLKAGYSMSEQTEVSNAKSNTDVIRLAAQYDVRDNVALNLGYAISDSDIAKLDGDMITAGMIVYF